MQIATNRMLACLQPKILCTEVDLKKVNELVDYIQAYTDANISSYDRNNWEEASYSLLSLFHQLFPHKHYMEFAYMPWKLLELFKENLNRGTIPTYWLTSWVPTAPENHWDSCRNGPDSAKESLLCRFGAAH
jgi:hypothetical protein